MLYIPGASTLRLLSRFTKRSLRQNPALQYIQGRDNMKPVSARCSGCNGCESVGNTPASLGPHPMKSFFGQNCAFACLGSWRHINAAFSCTYALINDLTTFYIKLVLMEVYILPFFFLFLFHSSFPLCFLFTVECFQRVLPIYFQEVFDRTRMQVSACKQFLLLHSIKGQANPSLNYSSSLEQAWRVGKQLLD